VTDRGRKVGDPQKGGVAPERSGTSCEKRGRESLRPSVLTEGIIRAENPTREGGKETGNDKKGAPSRRKHTCKRFRDQKD